MEKDIQKGFPVKLVDVPDYHAFMCTLDNADFIGFKFPGAIYQFKGCKLEQDNTLGPDQEVYMVWAYVIEAYAFEKHEVKASSSIG